MRVAIEGKPRKKKTKQWEGVWGKAGEERNSESEQRARKFGKMYIEEEVRQGTLRKEALIRKGEKLGEKAVCLGEENGEI